MKSHSSLTMGSSLLVMVTPSLYAKEHTQRNNGGFVLPLKLFLSCIMGFDKNIRFRCKLAYLLEGSSSSMNKSIDDL